MAPELWTSGEISVKGKGGMIIRAPNSATLPPLPKDCYQSGLELRR